MKKDQALANNPTMDDDYLFSASANDCTGLIPSVTHDEYEVENYVDLYPYLPPLYPIPDKISPPVTPVPEIGDRPGIPEIGNMP